MKFPRKVYMIRHNVTGRIYVGSSAEVEKRYANHLYNLRAGKHPVEDMQKDYTEHGEDYTFTLLDEISHINECHKEYDWMNKLNSYIRGIGYNYKDHASKTLTKLADDDSERDKAIKEINSFLEEQADADMIEFILSLLQKSYA